MNLERMELKLSPDIPLHTSLMQAIDECIERGIMPDILVSQKDKVIQMLLETFDQEKHDEAMKKDWYEAGKADGEKIGMEKGIRGLIFKFRKQSVPEAEIRKILCRRYMRSPPRMQKNI